MYVAYNYCHFKYQSYRAKIGESLLTKDELLVKGDRDHQPKQTERKTMGKTSSSGPRTLVARNGQDTEDDDEDEDEDEEELQEVCLLSYYYIYKKS